MDERDLNISRKLRRIAERIEKIVREETGEDCLIGLLVQPWRAPDASADDMAEFQYISNGPRHFMQEAMRSIVAKWDAGAPDIAPHKKQ